MPSDLLRRLGQMSAASPVQKKPEIKNPKLYEKAYPADEELFHLHKDALLRMGFTGDTFDVKRALFIDTETTGLSGGAGTVAFLVGCGYIEGDRFIVRQYLMPDYSAEPAMLSALGELFSRYDILVHYNGRRFDVPLLKDRFVMKRMDEDLDSMEQLDLLYPARKAWKLRLGCCRLSYIESAILGMPERDDIPGSEIPARYFESVKTGDIGLLTDVIEHNRQDIVTMTTLLVKLDSIYHDPEKVTEQLDEYSLGRAFERQGEIKLAHTMYALASVPRPIRHVSDLRGEKYAGEANLRLYRILRRNGDYESCIKTLDSMIRRKQLGIVPYIEKCKLFEHKLKRLEDAYEITGWLLTMPLTESETADVTKRRNRLKNKLSVRRENNV